MEDNLNNNVNPNMGQQSEGSSLGSIIAVIVILIVVVLGAAYFWKQRSGDNMMNSNADSIGTQSTSDATSDIEADLNNTDVNNVDYDLDPANFTSS